MLKTKRQSNILKQITLHDGISSYDLCNKMSASEDMTPRDLIELAESGK